MSFLSTRLPPTSSFQESQIAPLLRRKQVFKARETSRHFSLNCYFLLSSSETFFFLHSRKIETSHAFLIPRAFINLIVEATSILIRPSKRNNTITGYAIDIITNKFQHRRSNNLFHNLTELYFSNVQGEKRKE